MPGLNLRDAWIETTGSGRVFRVEIRRLEIGPGTAVALTGPSGSGKTLALELLGLLRAPGAGTRYCCGRADLAALWSRGPRGTGLARSRGRLFGFVPQSGGLIPFLTLAENVALPQRVNGAVDTARCAALIGRLGLSDVAGLFPSALSIGQRQRAAIARALAHRPRFVIADEPTASLDAASAEAVLGLLLAVATEEDCGVILSGHDLDRLDGADIPKLRFIVEGGATVVSRLEAGPC